MMLFLGMLALILLLVLGDLWLNRRRQRHNSHARERMAAYTRRLQKDWDVRSK